MVENETSDGARPEGPPGRTPAPPAAGGRRRSGRWGFGASAAVILAAMVVGEVVGRLFDPYWRAAKHGWQVRGDLGGLLVGLGDHLGEAGFGLRELFLAGFAVSSTALLLLQRRAVRDFFRSMHTGVALVGLSIVAVTAGVLVPQIEAFEDPEERVAEAGTERYEEEYRKFAWAEGYFLYHLTHLYGIGMPEEPLSPRMAEGLERFGMRYGEEERSNREKRMLAAVNGQAKTEQIRSFIERNEGLLRWSFDAATALDLNRAYKSYWFLTLMTLLFAGIAFNTFKSSWRRWFTLPKLGFFLVHMGMLVLLVGGAISKAFTDRGILHLFEGEPPQDVYWGHFDENKQRQMPFSVRLDHFNRLDWKALEVHFLDESFQSRVPRYTLWEDRVVDLDYAEAEGDELPRPGLRIRVKGLHNRAEVGLPKLTEDFDPAHPERIRPVAELEVPDVDRYLPGGGHVTDETRLRYLTPILGTDLMYDPGLAFRLRVAYGEDPEALFPGEDEILGHLLVEVAGQEAVAPTRIPVRLGERVEAPGGYQLQVVKATKNLQLTGDPPNQRQLPNTRPLAEQLPINPMVVVQVHPPGGGRVETRTVVEAIDPVEFGLQSKTLYPELVLRLRWDHWSSPGPERYVLHWDRVGEPVLLGESHAEPAPVRFDRALPLPGDGPVIVRNLYHYGVVAEQNIEFLPPEESEDGWEADFYSRDPRGVELEVVRWPGTPREEVHDVRLATQDFETSDWISPDGQIGLRFVENSEMLPFEWRSVLSILETDGEGKPYVVDLGSEGEREIRVNDYLTYRGYRFFQTNAHPELPTYSGIGVVYDPGIPVVLFGMYTIIAGSVVAFIVRPIASRKPAARGGGAS